MDLKLVVFIKKHSGNFSISLYSIRIFRIKYKLDNNFSWRSLNSKFSDNSIVLIFRKFKNILSDKDFSTTPIKTNFLRFSKPRKTFGSKYKEVSVDILKTFSSLNPWKMSGCILVSSVALILKIASLLQYLNNPNGMFIFFPSTSINWRFGTPKI